MTAVRLELSHHDAFMRMLDDYAASDPESGEWYKKGRDDFAAYIQLLNDDEIGKNPEPGFAPCSNRWLLDDQENIVGIVRIRHHIDTAFLFA